MPIYEFYCSDCHALYNFFSSRIDTETVPPCPRCAARLERKPAAFATLSRRSDEGGGEEDDLFAGLDEERMAGAMEAAMAEMEGAGGEDDPRQMAALFRRVGEAAGLEPGPRMEEMLARLEAGEDPDRLEEEMGDDLDSDDALAELFRRKRSGASGRRKPRLDPELYFL